MWNSMILVFFSSPLSSKFFDVIFFFRDSLFRGCSLFPVKLSIFLFKCFCTDQYKCLIHLHCSVILIAHQNSLDHLKALQCRWKSFRILKSLIVWKVFLGKDKDFKWEYFENLTHKNFEHTRHIRLAVGNLKVPIPKGIRTRHCGRRTG